MIVIEDKGRIKFFEGDEELSLQKGFEQLELLYSNEPPDAKKVIDRLRDKYKKPIRKEVTNA